MKNVLFASSEAVPFIKTGGLADVVGSLPRYFDKKEYDVKIAEANQRKTQYIADAEKAEALYQKKLAEQSAENSRIKALYE